MDIETRKILFVQEFLRLENEDVIIGLEKFMRKRKVELMEENITPMSLDQLESEVNEALNDSQNGQMIKANELKSKYQ